MASHETNGREVLSQQAELASSEEREVHEQEVEEVVRVRHDYVLGLKLGSSPMSSLGIVPYVGVLLVVKPTRHGPILLSLLTELLLQTKCLPSALRYHLPSDH